MYNKKYILCIHCLSLKPEYAYKRYANKKKHNFKKHQRKRF